MTDTNTHTGARLVSKVPSEEYKNNYEKIFGNKVEQQYFIGEDAEEKANLFLQETSNKDPNLEFLVSYKDSGILISYRNIK